jgi:hypothetical protein
MMLGPFSAPSSPPETPVPRNRKPSAVDQQVTLGQIGLELSDNIVYRGARLDHNDNGARRRDGFDKIGVGLRKDERLFAAELIHKGAGLLYGAVMYGDGKSMTGDIAREVLAHDGKPGKSDAWGIQRLPPTNS